MNHATTRLSRLFADRTHPLLGAFWPAGFPTVTSGAQALHALAAHGADILEVGIPHHRPHLDGPAISAAHQQAVAQGASIADALETIRSTAAIPRTAVVAMTYWDPVAAYGPERFARDLAQAGAAAAMIPDLPPRQRARWAAAAHQANLRNPQFIPWDATGEERTALARTASGWLYAPAVNQATGYQGDLDTTAFQHATATLRDAAPDVPLVAGIGISTPEHARVLAPLVDGVIIGSPFIRAALGQPPAAGIHAAAELVSAFADALRTSRSHHAA